MFDIGWPEMLVVAVVLIVVVGPKDLPGMLRNFGRTTTKLRAMAGDFRKQFDDALKEAELGDVKGIVDDVRKLNPAADIRKALNPMQKAAEDVRSGLDAAMRPAARPQAETDAAKGSVATAKNATPAAPLKNEHDKPAVKPKAAGGKAGSEAGQKAAPAKKVAAKPAAKSAAVGAPKAKPKASSKPAAGKAAGGGTKKGGQTR